MTVWAGKQEDVLSTMGSKGIARLFAGLESEDVRTRRASAKLICELAYQNDKAQTILSDQLSILVTSGKVCINAVPSKLQRLFKSSPHLLSALKKIETPLGRYWCFPPIDSDTYKKSLGDVSLFPDPKDFMIGFYVGTTRAPFIDTTTSYISEASAGQSRGASLNASKEESKSRNSSLEASPGHFASLRDPPIIRSELRTKPGWATSRDSSGHSSKGGSPAQVAGRFKSIEDSLLRIRAALEHKVEWPGSKTERSREKPAAFDAITEAFRSKRKEKRKESPTMPTDGHRFKHSEEAVLDIIRMKRKQLIKQVADRTPKAPPPPPRTASPFAREVVTTRPPFRV